MNALFLAFIEHNMTRHSSNRLRHHFIEQIQTSSSLGNPSWTPYFGFEWTYIEHLSTYCLVKLCSKFDVRSFKAKIGFSSSITKRLARSSTFDVWKIWCSSLFDEWFDKSSEGFLGSMLDVCSFEAKIQVSKFDHQ